MQSLLLSLSLAGAAVATPSVPRWHDKLRLHRQTQEPCAAVSAAYLAQTASAPSKVPVIDGQLGFDCLNSVSLHAAEATRLVQSIQPFIEWQTTQNYLKDPPEDYQFPAYDIPLAFDTIVEKVQNGTYANEYEFQADLYAAFNKAKDGHFRYGPDLLTAAITFRRGVGLASVSVDAKSAPEIYVIYDVTAGINAGGFTPSPVALINGEDAASFVEDLSLLGALQDRDALYNTMYYSPAFAATAAGDWGGYFAGYGRYSYIWPGNTTALTFANGTTNTYATSARIVGDFSGITDGESFYAKYCSGTKPVSQVATPTAPGPTATATPTGSPNATAHLFGYPVPVVTNSDLSAAGYYLPGTDVAVLGLVTYSPDVPAEFSQVVETFIADAKAAGKTRLIVDVSANGGGYIFQGHDTFRQLFPQTVQDGNNRWRSTALGRVAARQYSAAIPPGFDPLTSPDAALIGIYEDYWNYRFDYNVSDEHFASAPDKFAPVTAFQNDSFTPLHRWDFDDPLLTYNETYGIGFEITGYGNRTGSAQPFAADDIILLYDGYCASTCTLFSEFLRTQAGVRSVTFGGRPPAGGGGGDIPIIQNYGGVKGSNNVGYAYFNSLAETALAVQALNATSGPVGLSAAEVALLARSLDTYALNRSTGTSVNVRDNILPGHLGDGLPAQFVYEPTDCRLFYTPAGIVDPVAQWAQVAEAAWGAGGCVAGGLPTSTGRRMTRGVETPEQHRRSLERGKVISMPEKAVNKDLLWMAKHDTHVEV